jgi:hypothetical protein
LLQGRNNFLVLGQLSLLFSLGQEQKAFVALPLLWLCKRSRVMSFVTDHLMSLAACAYMILLAVLVRRILNCQSPI